MDTRDATAARARLAEERKAWRRERPAGFVAKPTTSADGSQNLLRWECKVPARESSIWAPAVFNVTMAFTPDYPNYPPIASFARIDGAPLFHPNVDGGHW